MFVYYEDVNSAVQILKPYLDLDYVRAYVYPMYYRHPTSEGADIVYNKLTELPDIMGITSWCSMFLNECKIPFQAFDHEKLRDIFCKKCMMENAYIKSLREEEQVMPRISPLLRTSACTQTTTQFSHPLKFSPY